jgi:hypothetical protein
MSTSVTRSDEEKVQLFKFAMRKSTIRIIFVNMNRESYLKLDWENEETLYEAALALDYFTRNGFEYKIDDYIPLEKQVTVKELIVDFNRLKEQHLTPRTHTSWY